MVAQVQESDMAAFEMDDWAEDAFEKVTASTRVPKVFYCSRTHQQLQQVVGELRRTVYGQTMKMAILSSRDNTCLQLGNENKNKLCAELLDPSKKKGCCYYTNEGQSILSSFRGLEKCGVKTPWDIEDLMKAGRETGNCPYFAARSLMLEADLIICPYNYIIDEGIRASMKIDVSGSVIIVDEAHNIENCCRDTGSLSMSISELDTIISNCGGLLKGTKSVKVMYAERIRDYCIRLVTFINSTILKTEGTGMVSIERWTGPQFTVALRQKASITPEATALFLNSVREASTAKTAEKDALRINFTPPPALESDIVDLLENLAEALQAATLSKYKDDYRMYIKRDSKNNCTETSLELLCMSPSVVFSSLSSRTRSIILASGTLSPMSTFEGELGVKFPYVVQADHVTPREQICIKCVDKDSYGMPVKATYVEHNKPECQDNIGKIILTACSSMAHGILVFFSAYGVMEKYVSRWQATDMWNKLSTIKEIFIEPRKKTEMDTVMLRYREAIVRTGAKPIGTLTGALLIAVYRGKAAEGTDFSDNEARCVVTIGIPYGVRQDPAVDLKIRYNDLNSRNKGLVGGISWYTNEAFRGLNQALGRAIRHRNDWGAIIMVDSRIMEGRHAELLPRWIKTMWSPDRQPNTDLRSLLNRFVAVQTRRAIMNGKNNVTKT